MIADVDLLAAEWLGEGDDALVIHVSRYQTTMLGNHLYDRRNLAALGIARRLDDVERLVQNNQLPFFELERIEVRVNVDAHRSPVHDDFGGSVFVRPRKHTVRVGRCAEFVDLFLEHFNLLLGFLQHVDELLVLGLAFADLLSRRVEAPSQRLIIGDNAIEPLSELVRVAAEEADRILELFDFTLERAFFGSTQWRIGVAARARTRGRYSSHYIANEALST